MEVVHKTNQVVGSFDWELPRGMADMLASFPPELHTAITAHLGEYLEEHLILLLNALVGEDPIRTILVLGLQNKEMRGILSIESF